MNRRPGPLMPRWRRPRTFALGWGAVLLVLVAAGVILEFAAAGRFLPHFLAFDWTHDGLHIALLALAAYMGFGAPERVVLAYARIFGLAGLLIAAAGTVPATHEWLGRSIGLHLEVGENVVHGLIGAWGLVVGFPRAAPRGPRRACSARGASA